jgi:hypothetical protein
MCRTAGAVGLAAITAAISLAAPASAEVAQASSTDDVVVAYTPEGLCGSIYTRAASHAISGATIYLMRATNHRKCVVTIKTQSVGTPTYTAAYLGAALDDGDYRYYAGPVNQQLTCARWGGQHRASFWISPTPYCD